LRVHVFTGTGKRGSGWRRRISCRRSVEAFEESIAKFDEVIEVCRIFGLPDYFVRVTTVDLESYEAFVSTNSPTSPGWPGRLAPDLKTVKSPDQPA
jgi:DNA-binding Lrp family transcriptional regulator